MAKWHMVGQRTILVRMTKELVLDDRRRANLAKVGRHDDHRYLVDEYENGVLVLTPAVTISAAELAALQNPAIREAVQSASRDRSQLRPRPRRGTGPESA